MKISKSVYLGLSALIMVLLISDKAIAQWGRAVKGNGNVVTQERQLGDFSGIKINSSVDVFVKQGSVNQVMVKADENLIDMIETDISGGVMKIDIDGSISRSRVMEVYLTVKNLDLIHINGSGDVESQGLIKGIDLDVSINGSGDVELDLDMKNVSASINGSGDVELSGISGDLTVKISGSGGFDAENLRLNLCDITVYGSGDVELIGSATRVQIEQSASGNINLYGLNAQDLTARGNGSGDMIVSVSGNLKVRLGGSGDLTYKGEPLSVDVSSTGSGDVYHR
jgi:hypothetical protein